MRWEKSAKYNGDQGNRASPVNGDSWGGGIRSSVIKHWSGTKAG